MDGYPTNTADLATWVTAPRTPGLYAVESMLPGGLAAHANIAVRAQAERIVVFLPGAQDAKSQRRIPFFHRWTWQSDLPDVHVIALGDPVIALNETILGGWFMHPEIDVVAELAAIVGRIADSLGVAPENVTFHGSSLGGFGALGMAAHLPGARAISEIPQIDVALWREPAALLLLEELVGAPLAEFRKVHPERVDVLDRLRFARVIPPFTLVTNLRDRSYGLHLQFMKDLSTLAPDCDVLGEQELLVTELASGHKPLPKDAALELLRTTPSS